MRTLAAAMAAFVILVALGVTVRSHRLPSQCPGGLVPRIPEILDPELGVCSRALVPEIVPWSARIGAWLPKDYNLSEESPANSIELAAALMAHPDVVRP